MRTARQTFLGANLKFKKMILIFKIQYRTSNIYYSKRTFDLSLTLSPVTSKNYTGTQMDILTIIQT